MKKRYIDGNEVFDLGEQAHHDRATLSKRRRDVEILIQKLYARQIALQKSYSGERSSRKIVGFQTIPLEDLSVAKQERTPAHNERLRLNSEESSVLTKREKAATERNRLANVRMEILMKREKAADERGEIADKRDQEADRRGIKQNALDKALTERESQLKLAEKAHETREYDLRQREELIP